MNRREVKQLEKWAKKLLKGHFDKFDLIAEQDLKINLAENKTILRDKFKGFLREEEIMGDKGIKAKLKNEREKEEHKQLKEIAEEEEKAQRIFEVDVFRLKESKATTTDSYKIPIEYIKSVARGYNKAFIFLGGCGLGKSYITRQTLAKEGVKFIESRGVNSPLGFYQFLYENNSKDLVLVFDDVSGLIDNPNAYSILLGVLWEGLASWNSTTTKLKIPKQFVFNGRIIIIANKLKGELNEFAKEGSADVVKSRCLTYRLNLDRMERIKMMYSIAQQPSDELSTEERVNIVDFIKDNTSQSSMGFDLRTQHKIERLFLYDRKNWKELAKPLLPTSEIVEIISYCLKENNSIKDAQRQFTDETGLSRATFYSIKSRKVQKSSEKPI